MLKGKKDVVRQLNKIREAHEQWLQIIPYPDGRYPGATINPDLFTSNGTRTVSAEIVDLIEELDSLVSDNHFEPEAFELVMACDKLIDAWSEWGNEVQKARPGEYTYLSSPDAPKCWSVFESVLKLIPERRYSIPESIESLSAQAGITHNQIASIYGWFTPSGDFDTNRVKEELQCPGRHYDPATWQNPERARHQDKMSKLWESRQHVKKFAAPSTATNEPNRKWADPPPAPEPIEQLLRMEGMTAHQVAKMKKISLEEVYEAAHALGIALDHSTASQIYSDGNEPMNRFKPMSEIQGKIDKHLDDEVAELKKGNKLTHALPDRVLELLRDNPKLDAGTILRVVSHRFPTATYETIKTLVDTIAPLYSGQYDAVPDDLDDSIEPDVENALNEMTRDQLVATAQDLGIDKLNCSNKILRNKIAKKMRETASV